MVPDIEGMDTGVAELDLLTSKPDIFRDENDKEKVKTIMPN